MAELLGGDTLSQEQVKMAMAALNWSNQQLADKAALGIVTVSRYINGQATSLKTSQKIETAFTNNGIEFIRDGDDSRYGGAGVRFSSFNFDPSPVDYHIHRFSYCISKDPQNTGLALMAVLNLLSDLECSPISEVLEIFDMLPINIEPELASHREADDENLDNRDLLNHWEEFYSLTRRVDTAIGHIRFQEDRQFSVKDLRAIRNNLVHGKDLIFPDQIYEQD